MEDPEIRCPDCRSLLAAGQPLCPGCGRDVASLLPTQRPEAYSNSPETLAKRIGDFRILRQIGRGGMGTVYEAYQESMRRKVALKVLDAGLLPSDDQTSRLSAKHGLADA